MEHWLSVKNAYVALNILGFIFAVLAAYYWRKASKAEVRYDPPAPEEGEWTPAAVTIDSGAGSIDFIQSVLKANELNATAAKFAFFAAGAQSLVYLGQAFSIT